MKTINISKLINRDPNLSIVLPGPCNAHCKFCFWDRKQLKGEVSGDVFISRMLRVLRDLPGDFQQISITGGEPLLSPFLMHVLTRIDKKLYPKVVLTTNGTGLLETLREDTFRRSQLLRVVDHFNISRHHHDAKDNAKLFGVKPSVLPSNDDLAEIAKHLHAFGKDLTLNCVNKTWSASAYVAFVQWAQDVGADAVCFRHPHGTLEPTDSELDMWRIYGIQRTNECPVCKTVIQNVLGLEVLWKASVSEPSKDAKGVFEAVIQPDGRLTADWAGKMEIDLDCDRAKYQPLPMAAHGTMKKEKPMAKKDALQRAIEAAEALHDALLEMQATEDHQAALRNAWHRPSHGTKEPEPKTKPRRCMCPDGEAFRGCSGLASPRRKVARGDGGGGFTCQGGSC